MQGQAKAVGDETGKWVGTVILWTRRIMQIMGSMQKGRTASQDGGGVDPCDDDLEVQHSYFAGTAC
jgi:hypothetical protein